MKVTKAIEILEDILRYVKPGDPPDEHDAIKLGIEALKRHRNRDYLTYNEVHELLPGESPEQDVKSEKY